MANNADRTAEERISQQSHDQENPEQSDVPQDLSYPPTGHRKRDRPFIPNAKDSEKEEAPSSAPNNFKTQQEALQPVSFFTLFRFTTRTEKFLNAIGASAAISVGVAQPLMTLVFGSLTKAFIDFGSASQALKEGRVTMDKVDAARSHFKQVAGHDTVYLVYIGLAVFVFTYVHMYTWVYTGEVNSKRIRELYLRAVLRQEIAFFDNVGAGEVATRIQTDTHLIQRGTSEKVALCLAYVSAFVTCFFLAYIRSWRLALALSAMLPLITITGSLMNKHISRCMHQSLKHVAEGGSMAEEVVSTIRTTHAFGIQKIHSKLFDERIALSRAIDLKAAIIHGAGLGCFFFIIYSSYALAFSFGTTLIIHGYADVSVVVSVFNAILIGSSSLSLLAPEAQAIAHARAAAAKLFATINRIPTIDSEDFRGFKPETVRGDLTFEHVDFSYPSRPDVPVLRDLSISFPAGKTCALVGASGSGKSTVTALIERFYDPLPTEHGCVKLDGIDLRDLNVKWLRRQIGLVSQEPVLFATTIWVNVAYGLIGTRWENAPYDEKDRLVRDACIMANADGFISDLPLGYETIVGDRGFLLSGGQKQRVAIARAIVSNPKILILDEATSALDTQSENVVQDALDKAAEGRTTIAIAHRLSTVRNADCTFVMGGGQVLEQGSHEELLSDPDGAYSKLVQAQKLREEREEIGDEECDDQRGDLANGGIAGSSFTLTSFVDYTGKQPLLKSDAGPAKDPREKIPLLRVGTQLSLPRPSEISKQTLRGGEESGRGKQYTFLQIFKRMGSLQRDGWVKYALGIVFGAMTGMVYPTFGIVYAISLSTFEIDNDNRKLRVEGDRNALWFFIIATLSVICIVIQNYCLSSAAASLTFKLRSLAFKSVLRQDIEYFDDENNRPGSIVANLSENPQKINGIAGVTFGTIIQSISTILTGCIIGLVFQWKLALVGMACMPLLLSVGYIRLLVVVLKDRDNKAAHESSAQIACEASGAVRTVASLTREQDCCEVYSKSLEQPLNNSKKMAIYSNAIYGFSQATVFFIIALVFWYGSLGVANEEYGTTAFFVCLFSVVFGTIQAGNIFSFVPDISSARAAAADIMNVMDSRPKIDLESTEGIVPQDARGRVCFEDVHFRYPTRPGARVLRGLNLAIETGTYIALVGASGCGKSTIIQLVERFYDPLAGKITLDGCDISKLNIAEYRKHVALVSQEPTLYSGTIRFNILLGAAKPHDEVTQEEIEIACKDANILDFIQQLPKGFDTEVGGKGSQLSGGQKQRIAIARALLRNPKVLLLDEATSALDSTSQKIVQQALDQAAKGRTTIAIAHSLSTIQNADRIYFIKDGNISESGTHDELLALRGGYFEFVQLQALSNN